MTHLLLFLMLVLDFAVVTSHNSLWGKRRKDLYFNNFQFDSKVPFISETQKEKEMVRRVLDNPDCENISAKRISLFQNSARSFQIYGP